MKNLLRIMSVVALVVLLSFSFSKEKKIVVIDAGHGGNDLGANRNGISEKEIVLNIAKKIKALNLRAFFIDKRLVKTDELTCW